MIYLVVMILCCLVVTFMVIEARRDMYYTKAEYLRMQKLIQDHEAQLPKVTNGRVQ